jgi:hypothetical protein
MRIYGARTSASIVCMPRYWGKAGGSHLGKGRRVASKYLTFASHQLVHSNGFNSPSNKRSKKAEGKIKKFTKSDE